VLKLLDKIYIQVWSINEELNGDFEGAFKKLGSKGIGYSGLEFAGYGDVPAEKMLQIINDNNLEPLGTHIYIDELLNDLDSEIAYAKTLGIKYIICSMSPMENKNDVLELAKKLVTVNEKIRAAGMKFGYHNHAHEFVKDGGEYLLDILFDNLPDDVVMELDVYWSELAMVDTYAYMEKHKNRLELLHIKQIGEYDKNVEVDKGFINFPDLIAKAKAQGVLHFILEQEEYENSPMESAKGAFEYLNGL